MGVVGFPAPGGGLAASMARHPAGRRQPDAAPAVDEAAVERVARAIYDVSGTGGGTWETVHPVTRDACRYYARAAIDAMRPAPDAPQADDGAAIRQRFIEAIDEADAHAGARTQGESESAVPFNRGFVLGLCCGASIAGMDEDVWASPERHERQKR